MIEFRYLGESHFANVFEYGSSPALFYIQFIIWHESPHDKIVLKETADGIRLSDSSRPIHQELLDSIIEKIMERRRVSVSN